MRAITALWFLVALAAAGCGDSAGEAEPRLQHALYFESTGQLGFHALTLEPDGSAQGEINLGDPFAFTLDDETLAKLAAAVQDAELADQPSELRGDEPDFSDEIFIFRYAEARVTAEWEHSPSEIKRLGELLTDVVRAHGPAQ